MHYVNKMDDTKNEQKLIRAIVFTINTYNPNTRIYR